MDELLTVQDCAVILSVNEYQIRDYINKGLLKAHKLGADKDDKSSRRWRIWQKDLTDFINHSEN
jgi:hypothetical protein